MDWSHFASALLGGLVGGILGVFSAVVASYWGPRKLEQARAADEEEREHGPRKRLLMQMLSEPNPRIRSFTMLRHVTGTTDEDCRRLLIEIGARGVVMRGGKEGWALIDRYGFTQPPVRDETLDDL
jgi:hypothetical protein